MGASDRCANVDTTSYAEWLQVVGGAAMVADLNNDGALDVLVASQDTARMVDVYLHQGHRGAWTQVSTGDYRPDSAAGPFATVQNEWKKTLSVGDLDQDGDLDLLLIINGVVHLIANDGAAGLVECGALETSLWELLALRCHYLPAAAQFATLFEGKLDKHAKDHDVDEMAALTYQQLFDKEVQRKMKDAPLTFAKPAALFEPGEVFEDAFVM